MDPSGYCRRNIAVLTALSLLAQVTRFTWSCLRGPAAGTVRAALCLAVKHATNIHANALGGYTQIYAMQSKQSAKLIVQCDLAVALTTLFLPIYFSPLIELAIVSDDSGRSRPGSKRKRAPNTEFHNKKRNPGLWRNLCILYEQGST